MELAFWTCAFWVVYAFIGYPLLTALLGRLLNRSVSKGTELPTVTVVIAAYNEAQHIVATVMNKLEQEYPADSLRVVVVSDESSDGTDALVQDINDPRASLIRQSRRQGKTAALNLALPNVDSEIVVFSDANSLYKPDAIAKLVRNFASDDIGYVTGKLTYASTDANAVGDGCSSYMRFENWIRQNETLMGSIVGVDGGIDALRRDAYQEMNADQQPDFVLPLLIRKQGYRVIYEPEAHLIENALDNADSEFRMRVRVSLRAMWAIRDLAAVLNPFRYGLFAIQLWSHKLLRYLAVAPLALLPLISYALINEHWLFSVAFWAQIAFYSLALIATSIKSPPAMLSLPYYFTLVNAASGIALWKFLRGKKQIVWQPRLGG